MIYHRATEYTEVFVIRTNAVPPAIELPAYRHGVIQTVRRSVVSVPLW